MAQGSRSGRAAGARHMGETSRSGGLFCWENLCAGRGVCILNLSRVLYGSGCEIWRVDDEDMKLESGRQYGRILEYKTGLGGHGNHTVLYNLYVVLHNLYVVLYNLYVVFIQFLHYLSFTPL